MISKETSFARFSRPICWAVSLVMLLIALFVFTGDSNNPMITGFLWLAGAVAFAVSGLYLSSKARSPQQTQQGEEQPPVP